jgi:predicted RNase H-like HicB family nuclease
MTRKAKPASAPAPSRRKKATPVRVKVIIHQAEEGGYWAEVPALPGCFTEADTREQLVANLREAIEGVLLGPPDSPAAENAEVEEIELWK